MCVVCGVWCVIVCPPFLLQVGYDHCGVYMPSFYWARKGTNWQFKCEVDFDQIEKQDPKLYKQIAESLQDVPKEQWKDLACTCGAKFIPWACGASKVVEIRVEGVWHALLAERLPEELDDEIKKVLFEFHKAMERVTPDDIMKAIPTTFPKTNLCQRSRIPGISRFDFNKWEQDGKPTLLKVGWIALANMIANKDERNLQNVISMCALLDHQEEKHKLNPSLAEAM